MHASFFRRAALAAALLGAFDVRAATQLDLLPAQAGDLQSTTLVPAREQARTLAGAPVSHEAVQFSWAAHGNVTPPSAPAAQSHETWFETTADQLAAGITLHTTAPRALVQLQPLGASAGPREALAIHPQSLTLAAQGKSFADGAGMEALVSADKLAKADIPFAPGTSAFRIHPSLGSGDIVLKADGLSGSQRYLVQVVEPDSPLALSLQTDALNYLHGHPLAITAELADSRAGARPMVNHVEGRVVAPDGRSFPVAFQAGKDGKLHASLTLDADADPAPGLWEVQASVGGTARGQRVERAVRVAFSAALPTARLSRTATLDKSSDGLAIGMGVEAASPGRYEVRALVYGTVGGRSALLGVADAAQWLEPGAGAVVLDIPAALLAGARGPYELRDLTLFEQTRMAVLERQQRALSFDDAALPRAMPAPAIADAAPVHVKRPPSLAGQ